MTGKRFMYELYSACFRDDGKVMTTEEVVHTLNELHEENERLKQNINELLSVDIEEELLKENEQLKNENAKMKKELGLLAEFNQKAML